MSRSRQTAAQPMTTAASGRLSADHGHSTRYSNRTPPTHQRRGHRDHASPEPAHATRSSRARLPPEPKQGTRASSRDASRESIDRESASGNSTTRRRRHIVEIEEPQEDAHMQEEPAHRHQAHRSQQLQASHSSETGLDEMESFAQAASESGSYEEVIRLVGTNVQDHALLVTNTRRVQEMVKNAGNTKPADAHQASAQLREAATRVWTWLHEHADQLQRCKDVHAAICLVASELLALSFRVVSTPTSYVSMSAQDHQTQMRMHTKAGKLAAEAAVAPPDSVHASMDSPHSLLIGADIDGQFSCAFASLETMKFKGLECDPALEWNIYQERAQYQWQTGQFESAFESYATAVRDLFLAKPNAMKEHFHAIYTQLHDKGQDLQQKSDDAKQAIKWLQLCSQMFETDPNRAQTVKKQGRCLYSLAVLYLTVNQPKDALAAIERSLLCRPDRIEALIVQAKATFMLQMFQDGQQALQATIASNSCTSHMAIDVVEFCCQQLRLDVVAAERDARIDIIRDAYARVSAKFPTYESTIVSQFRTMIQHQLFDLALDHLDRALSLSNLSVQTLQALRESTWAESIELFELKEFSRCLAWLQRYSKKMSLDDADTDVRAMRSLAIVALEMNDFANAMMYAEDARRLSQQAKLEDGLHLPTALIIRAAIGLHDLQRAREELQELTAHARELGDDIESSLVLIGEDLMQREEGIPIAIVCLDLLLQLQLRDAPSTDIAPNATRPFTPTMLLVHLISMCKAEHDRLSRAKAKGSQRLLQIKSGGAAPMDLDETPQLDPITAVEIKLAAYFEQLIEVTHSQRHQHDDASLTEKEIIWLALSGWNLGRSAAAAEHLELSWRFFQAAAQLYDRLDGDHQQRSMAAFARVYGVMAYLEHARTVSATSEQMEIGEACLKQLSRGESALRLLVSQRAPPIHAQLDPTQLCRLLPALQLKARLFKGETEGAIQQFIKSLHESSTGVEVTRDQWDAMAGLVLRFHQTHAAYDCLHHAIMCVPATELAVAARFWRKLISVVQDQQMVTLYAELQAWLESQSENDAAAKAPLHKRYPKVEAEWLVNHAWNVGTLYYRQRELSQALKCMRSAQRVHQLLLRGASQQEGAMQLTIEHVQSSLDGTTGKK